MNRRPNILVLISGNGSNLQYIINAIESHRLYANILGVISNKKTAYGLKRAKKHGIKTLWLEKEPGQSREEYDDNLTAIINGYYSSNLDPVKLIVLAGWMHIFSRQFLQRTPVPIINLHPALPRYDIIYHTFFLSNYFS